MCLTIPNIDTITQISCGGNHNLALVTNTSNTSNSNTNDVYSWGYGDMLALGHGLEQDEPVPRRINWNKCKDTTSGSGSISGKKNRYQSMMITQVAGGGQHSAMIGRVIETV